MIPLELLYEPADLPAFALPQQLSALYPGMFGLPDDCLYVNFVETLDGVVALPDVPRSNRIVADESEADLFVMALLRACADVIVIGSHTFLASPRNRWTAEAAYPDAAAGLTELRRSLGLRAEPDVVVISRLRELESETLAGRLSVRSSVTDAVADLRARGARRILCEGGPTLFGSMLSDDLVDELFVTVSPVVAGRGLSLVEGVELLPDRRIGGTLSGVRRHGSHLFLRYLLAG
ncbi:MAG TPA: dihydrofolate reductase family protein [Gaiellaceae bacterium]|nr:dihydrofolate reductase family protein [Gaiellaceae bacterium]